MKKDISDFQAIIFSILMRNKGELFQSLENMIANETSLLDLDKIIRTMFYEVKMPDLEKRIHLAVNNEITFAIPDYFQRNNIDLKIQRTIDREIEKRIKELLRDNDSLESIKSKNKSNAKFIIKKPELLDKLKEKHRFVIKYRDGNSEEVLSISEIAYKLDISSTRVRQIQSSALRFLEYFNKKVNGDDASPSYEYL